MSKQYYRRILLITFKSVWYGFRDTPPLFGVAGIRARKGAGTVFAMHFTAEIARRTGAHDLSFGCRTEWTGRNGGEGKRGD